MRKKKINSLYFIIPILIIVVFTIFYASGLQLTAFLTATKDTYNIGDRVQFQAYAMNSIIGEPPCLAEVEITYPDQDKKKDVVEMITAKPSPYILYTTNSLSLEGDYTIDIEYFCENGFFQETPLTFTVEQKCDPDDVNQWKCDGNILIDGCNELIVYCSDADSICDFSEDVGYYACVRAECTQDEECDDGNPCTDDECFGGDCQHYSNTAECGENKICKNKNCIEKSCREGEIQNKRCEDNTLIYEECLNQQFSSVYDVCDLSQIGSCNPTTLQCEYEEVIPETKITEKATPKITTPKSYKDYIGYIIGGLVLLTAIIIVIIKRK